MSKEKKYTWTVTGVGLGNEYNLKEEFKLDERLQKRVDTYQKLRELGMTLEEAQFLLVSYGWFIEDGGPSECQCKGSPEDCHGEEEVPVDENEDRYVDEIGYDHDGYD